MASSILPVAWLLLNKLWSESFSTSGNYFKYLSVISSRSSNSQLTHIFNKSLQVVVQLIEVRTRQKFWVRLLKTVACQFKHLVVHEPQRSLVRWGKDGWGGVKGGGGRGGGGGSGSGCLWGELTRVNELLQPVLHLSHSLRTTCQYTTEWLYSWILKLGHYMN